MKISTTPEIAARFHAARGSFTLDVDLAIPARGVTSIFGPSGAGKTSILRAIAGLEHHAGGFLEVNGETWQDEARGLFVPPHRRAVGCVFQEANLFPHLAVRGNLDNALRRRRPNAHPVSREDVVALLGIGHLLERAPGNLSGGERQRVAIARALLTSPRLLLLDEPLASLDAARRREILPYLQRLRDELEIPIVFVSHAVDEVMRIADHLVLLNAGRVVESGPLGAMLARLDLPETLSRDPSVVVEGIVAAYDAGYRLLRLDVAGGSLHVSHNPVAVGERLRVQIQARDVSLALERPRATSIVNVLEARVVEVRADNEIAPASVLVLLDVGGTRLMARITRYSSDRLRLVPGIAVWAQIKAVAVLA